MAGTVRVSARSARALLESMENSRYVHGPADVRAIDELRAALAKLSRSRPRKASAQKAKTAKRKTKREETQSVRGAVVARAGNQCEACGAQPVPGSPLTLDHFFGRARAPQTAANCWLLCWSCHQQKTDNAPTATYWLEVFAGHAQHHGFWDEASKANAALESRADIAQAAAISRAVAP